VQSLGIIIIGTIILFLLGFGCRSFFINADVPLALRVGVGVIGGGVLFLVIRTIRFRLARTKAEKFKEVEK
jgi:multisubunit Na+/H+ antiporter MnhB subunit